MTPKFRQVLYTVGVVVFALLTILSTLKVIDPNVAASVSAALTAVLGMFGVTVAGTAAYNTSKQINDGVFDRPKPDIGKQVAEAVEQVLKDKIQQTQTQVRDVPVLGPLAQEILNRVR